MGKIIIQYLVFDKSGNEILDADAYVLKGEEQVEDLVSDLKDSFLNLKKNDKEWKDLGLVLMNNTSGKVLYNSREEK